MPNILDPAFKYTPSVATDLRKKFKQIIRDREAEKVRAEAIAEAAILERTQGLAEHHDRVNATYEARRALQKAAE